MRRFRIGRGRWMAMALSLTTIGTVGTVATVASSPRVAFADSVADQEVRYTLYLEGKPAGTHTLKISHFAPRRANGEETRIIESYEDIRGPDVPEALWRRTRATARASGNTLSFTAVTETGRPGSQKVTEVNGRRDFDGRWTLHITRGLASETVELRRSQADLCTLDLLDPVLHARLLDRPSFACSTRAPAPSSRGAPAIWAKPLPRSAPRAWASTEPASRPTPTPGRLTGTSKACWCSPTPA